MKMYGSMVNQGTKAHRFGDRVGVGNRKGLFLVNFLLIAHASDGFPPSSNPSTQGHYPSFMPKIGWLNDSIF